MGAGAGGAAGGDGVKENTLLAVLSAIERRDWAAASAAFSVLSQAERLDLIESLPVNPLDGRPFRTIELLNGSLRLVLAQTDGMPWVVTLPQETTSGAAGQRRQIVVHPPGTYLRRLGSFLFTRKTFEGVLEPVLEDLQIEVFESLTRGETARARWIRCVYTGIFLATALRQIPVSLLSWVFRAWKMSP